MKKRTITFASLLSVTIFSAAAASSAFAYDKGSTDGVVGVLLKKYPLTETTMDKTQITHDGVQLSLKQAGVYAYPAKGYVNWESKVQDGKVQKQNFIVSASCSKAHCHVMQTGEKVYVTKIESKNDNNNDVLKFTVLSVEDIDGGDGAERYSAAVSFKLKKGLLSEGSPDDIEQIVEAVLAPADDTADSKQDTASAAPAATQPAAPVQRAAAPPPPPPPPAPAAPPPPLSIGETSSQVLQAYGMPTKIVDLGKKKTFFYKDIKVIFTDDKISDMQPL